MSRQDDPLLLWEQDGDLERMKMFFGGLSSGGDKERIKEMVLVKLEQNEDAKPGIEQAAVDIPEHMVAEPKQTVDKPERMMGERITNPLSFPGKIKMMGRRVWQRWGWKLALPAMALVLVAFIGQAGLSGQLGKGSFLSQAKTGSAVSDQSAASAPNYAAKSEEQRQSSSASMADVGAGQSQGSTDSLIMADGLTPAPNNRESYATAVVPPIPGPAVPPADADLPRKITHNLNIALQVENIEPALQKLTDMAQNMGGYIVDSQMDNQQNAADSAARITLKVPAAKLESARSSLSEIGKVLHQHLIANDITNQYYDADTRLKHWQAEEKRYTDILNQAKTVDDILKVEQALSNIRMQIEQLQGQLKLWNHEVAFSTISLQLQTKPNPVNVDEPWQPVSWGKTWEAAQNAVLKTISSIWNALNYLVVGLGYALPFMILGGAGYFAYLKWRKSRSE